MLQILLQKVFGYLSKQIYNDFILLQNLTTNISFIFKNVFN